MAIRADNTAVTGRVGNLGTWSWYHTVSTGANLLVVTIAIHSGGGGRTVNTATYNGVAMTRAVRFDSSAEIWYLVNPTVGVNAVTLTWASNPNEGSASSISFFGADVLNPLFATATNSATSAPTITLDASSGGVTLDAIYWQTSSTLTPTSPQVQLMQVTQTNNNTKTLSSYRLETSGGSKTMTWTGGSAAFNTAAAAFKAAPEGGSFLYNLL
jgi:hypothetical protein